MTIEEIYENLTQRMLTGVMFHSDMIDYYRFLGLDGYAKFHEHRMIEESVAYRETKRKYLQSKNKLVHKVWTADLNVIPDGWYQHTRQDVDTATIKNGIKDGLEKWIVHETETLRIYSDLSRELRELGEVELAICVEKSVKEVSEELAKARKYHLNKEHIGYDLPTIVSEQKYLCEKY